MNSREYFTKSALRTAIECPTKLFYYGKSQYVNKEVNDPLLESLADGGFQVGELAKCYFPSGVQIDSLDHFEAIKRTKEALKQKQVIIYEAAIACGDLFVRIDILVKDGDEYQAIEVKAKSVDSTDISSILSSKGSVKSSWKTYVEDIAFQYFVLKKSFPKATVYPYLMVLDKKSKCSFDGLNQNFRIIVDSKGRRVVKTVRSLSNSEIADNLLCIINVIEPVNDIIFADYSDSQIYRTYEERVEYFATSFINDFKITPEPGSKCTECEYRVELPPDKLKNKRNGFKECWKEAFGYEEGETVLDIWNLRKKDRLISENKYAVRNICKEDIGPESTIGDGLTIKQRQWLQIEKIQKGESDIWFDATGLRKSIESWSFPLHFIDFETSTSALPFHKNMSPYEAIAFQFSHHIVHENGRIEHKGQYLSNQRGFFPNFEMVRALKKELENDLGTVFRYSLHENTILNIIYNQLDTMQTEIDDKEELKEFIRSITLSTKDKSEFWEGSRKMVDLCEVIKKFYYNPITKGSNSIKALLPAMISSSDYIQKKYSNPIYGAKGGVSSLNFQNWKWVVFKNGELIQPYKLLTIAVSSDTSNHDFDACWGGWGAQVADGTAAMNAYARMQYEDLSRQEYRSLRESLLKYCELDTFAMVMIYEGLLDLVQV